MARPFSGTLRSLEADSFRRSALLLSAVALLLAAWVSWFLYARVPIYVTSRNARLEVARGVYPIDSPVSGRIRSVTLAIGLEVRRGDVVAELEAGAEEIRAVRAPATGRIGEITPTSVGQFVSAGSRLASVVPVGELAIVAHFGADAAVGRIRPRQRARLRLDAFPWTQYGSLPAQVTSVASEPVGGDIRVELTPGRISESEIPLQHGLVGTVEVEVDRESPADLVLRAAGQRLSGASRRRASTVDPVPPAP